MGDEFLDRIERLGVMTQNGMRAPHRPLLLLLALGRVLAGRERLEFYAVLENPLKRLLVSFGPPRKTLHPEAPFGWLRTDKLWEIPDDGRLPANSWGTLHRSGLIRHAARGGFPEDIFRLLRRDPDLVRRAAQLLLDKHFPRSLHERILAAVNIPAEPAARWVQATERSRAFGKEVLLAYESRCAVCGYHLRMNDEVIGLDAAHMALPKRYRSERARVVRPSPRGPGPRGARASSHAGGRTFRHHRMSSTPVTRPGGSFFGCRTGCFVLRRAPNWLQAPRSSHGTDARSFEDSSQFRPADILFGRGSGRSKNSVVSARRLAGADQLLAQRFREQVANAGSRPRRHFPKFATKSIRGGRFRCRRAGADRQRLRRLERRTLRRRFPRSAGGLASRPPTSLWSWLPSRRS